MNTLLLSLLRPIVSLLPETRLFGLKRFLYRACGAKIADGVRICSSAKILGAGDLIIGANTWIGHEVLIVSGELIEVGADVDIAPRVFIGTGTHERGHGAKAAGAGKQKSVKVGDGCWLGVSCVILPGVELAPITTVGAGAIVTKNSVAGTTVVGNPAREKPAAAGI